MMRKLLILAALLPALSHAEHSPPPGKFDPRVRTVAYNPLDIVAINTYYGVSTAIRFADDEVIEKESMDAGDRVAWSIKTSARQNILFVRPKAQRADTNLTVVTSKRLYMILLNVLPAAPAKSGKAGKKDTAGYSMAAARSPALTYSLTYTYPEDDKARAAGADTRRTADELRTRLAGAKNRASNYDYWIAGAAEVSPISARDDGRFIYLTFAPNRGRPAISSIDSQGKPTALSVTIDGNTVIVPRMARLLRFEKGDLVACLVNRSFNPAAGSDNASGTISPNVVRVIKGAP